MKISIITIAYNNEKDIRSTLESVISQTYSNIEYILVDGKSTDKTLDIINEYRPKISKLISEPDEGIYDAINKGIKASTGEIVGLIHAGDELYDNTVIEKIANHFKQNNVDAIYGHTKTYSLNKEKVIRITKSPEFKSDLFKYGWMPPHQSFYIKKELFEQLGYYSLKYKIAADYELMLRFIHFNKINVDLLDVFIMKFTIGGLSSKNIKNGIKHSLECAYSWKDNGKRIPFYTLPLKLVRRFIRTSRARL